MNFLNNNVRILINTDLFLGHHYHIFLEKDINYQKLRAYEVDHNRKREHIKSTLGEYFEREVLLNGNCTPNVSHIMTSIVDGSIKTMSLAELIFIDEFVDSCGMASHISSREVIWKAYKEFFERQSFVSSFLFQLPASEIKLEKDENELITNHQYILNFLDEIKYYNISLCGEIVVILALGWAEETKAAGLGTSRNMKDSIEKAQKEILQYFSVKKSKRNRMRKQYENTTGDAYHTYFDKLTVTEFKNEYGYLLECKEESSIVENQVMDKKVIIQNNFIDLNMNPYIAVFSQRQNEGVKVVKLKDEYWFPNMLPESYKKEQVEELEKRFGWKRKNYSDKIPFA